MEKKNSINEQEIKKSTNEQRKQRKPSVSVQINDKKLPWWVNFYCSNWASRQMANSFIENKKEN